MQNFTACCLSVLVLSGLATAQERITQADLLNRIVDLDRLMTPPPEGERTAMFSSYDRHSQIDADGNYVDWDFNIDFGQFIRRADGWDVMAEMEGPGAITRLWSANPHGDIRFVLDGEVVIEAPFGELMSGNLEPFTEPLVYRGLNCYFPIGYAKSCRVECRRCTAYYQINYVQFAPGTEVQRFQFELDEEAQAAFARVEKFFKKGPTAEELAGGRRLFPMAAQEDVQAGSSLTWDLDGDGTIRAIYVALTDRSDPRESYALHRCLIQIFVDGEDKPCVEAPLCDFFGSGFELVPFNSFPIGTDNRRIQMPLPDRLLGEDRFMYCYFPIPYRHGMRLEIKNLSDDKRPIGLLLYMQVDTQTPVADAMRFHAGFRKEDPCQVLDFPILEATGRGRVVGCVLNVDCPRPVWWGEGDDKVWIDGETFPSYFGTGSEDYLGDAWGLHEFIRPLNGVTRTGPYGKNSAYRWHIADDIEFQKSIRFTIENWQFGGFKDTYYSTVVYWYAAAGATDFFQPLTLEDVTPPGLRIPGAIEAEDSILTPDWGNAIHERYTRGIEFSGQQVANITTDRPVDASLPSDADRIVRLKLRTNPRRPFEAITVTDATGRAVGTARYNWAPDGIYTVGILHLAAGNNDITVQCSRPAQIDCWILEDVPRNGRGPEGEDLALVAGNGAETRVDYGQLDWSAGAQLGIDFSKARGPVTFALPVQAEATRVGLRLQVTRAPREGRFQALLNDKPVGAPFESSGELGIQRVDLGVVELDAGANTLGFKALAGRELGLDVVELVHVHSRYALEGESLPITGEEASNHCVQGIDGASAEAHLWCRPIAPGAWIEVEVPVAQAGQYHVRVVYTTSLDYGLVQAYLNGEQAGDPVDTFATRIVPGLVSDLGVHKLAAGPLKMRFEVIGKSERSPGYFFGVDCVELEPVTD